MNKVAISYSHSEKFHAKFELFIAKLEQNNIETIYDKKNLSAGADLSFFMEKITLGEDIDCILVVSNRHIDTKRITILKEG